MSLILFTHSFLQTLDTVTSTAEYLFKGIHSRGHSFQHYSGRPHDFSQLSGRTVDVVEWFIYLSVKNLAWDIYRPSKYDHCSYIFRERTGSVSLHAKGRRFQLALAGNEGGKGVGLYKLFLYLLGMGVVLKAVLRHLRFLTLKEFYKNVIYQFF